MRSRIDFVAGRVATNLDESGTEVTLLWNAYAAGADVDPVTQVVSGTPTPQSECIQAFLHFVSASSAVRQFNEIQIGDCLMDISPEVDLTGRSGLVFILPTGPHLSGQQWTSKPVSAELSAAWDVMQGNRRLFQTILLRKGT